jgi:hypothetical protein
MTKRDIKKTAACEKIRRIKREGNNEQKSKAGVR